MTSTSKSLASCLNDYQLGLLRCFVRAGVRFVVVGGQARQFYFGDKTRDLDIWVDISPKHRPALEAALVEWSAEHPMHTEQRILPPLNLRPNVQIKFPDTDGCQYLDRLGEPTELSCCDGVDILTSLGSRNFEAHFVKSNVVTIEGVPIHVLDKTQLLESQRSV